MQTNGSDPEADRRVPDYYAIPGLKAARQLDDVLFEVTKDEDPKAWRKKVHHLLQLEPLTFVHLVHALNANHQIGNILKYAIRLGRKPGVPVERDLKKIVWCALSELERLGTHWRPQ